MRHTLTAILIMLISSCCPPPRVIELDYLFTAERVTCYNLVPEQTDSTPLIAKWYDYTNEDPSQYYGLHCAVSPDVLKKYRVKKHDTLYIDLNNEFKQLVVTDITSRRFRNTIDILEPMGVRYKHTQIHVYEIVKK
jgi:hypothetical protein